MTQTQLRDCRVCGGDGWLPSLPEGRAECPACKGTGKETHRVSDLDAAVLAHRREPTEENRLKVLAAQEAHTTRFYGQQAEDFVRTT